MNPFKDVPSSQLKKQIRAIYTDLRLIEDEGWILNPDTGNYEFDPGSDYLSSDLIEHAQKIKCELAQRWFPKPEPKIGIDICPYCGSDNIEDVFAPLKPEDAPDLLRCIDCNNTWEI